MMHLILVLLLVMGIPAVFSEKDCSAQFADKIRLFRLPNNWLNLCEILWQLTVRLCLAMGDTVS